MFARQVYAPTDMPRALCIFGCNRAACSAQRDGWRAVRTQRQPLPPAAPSDVAANSPRRGDLKDLLSGHGSIPAHRAPITLEHEPPSAWEVDDDESWDEGAGTEIDWGLSSSVGEIGDGNRKQRAHIKAMEELLTAQEKAFHERKLTLGTKRENACSHVDTSTASVKQSRSATLQREHDKPCFPAKLLTFNPEPPDQTRKQLDDGGMQQMLRRYLAQEEDRDVVAALNVALDPRGRQEGSGEAGTQVAAAVHAEKYEGTPKR